MKQFKNNPEQNINRLKSVLLLLAGLFSFIFISPKWLMPLCAWTGPATLLFFYRFSHFKRKLLWVLGILLIAQTVAFYEVVPIPGAALIIFVLLNALIKIIPFAMDKTFAKRSNSFWTTLIFPVTYTAFDFISSFGPWGAWGSVANTQFAFSWFNQLASVTGIWGISFMVYWFGSYTTWLVNHWLYTRSFPKGALVFPLILATVIIGGAVRYCNHNTTINTVKIAGIAQSNIPFLQALYKDVNGKSISIDDAVSPVSSQLRQASTAMVSFVEQPDSVKFYHSLQVLDSIYNQLFKLSRQAVDSGAKIIVWSEGSIITWKQNEVHVMQLAQNFAKQNNVDLVIGMASFETGKITPGKHFMENKAIYINHEGTLLNTLYKNKPVPGIEPSSPGNGIVPFIKTTSGNVSTSICYDADFPSLMNQLGKNKSGLLILPSGDWKAIAPYHTQAAIYRAIENGCSILRVTNGGLSAAADYRGQIIASRDFFDKGQKILLANISVEHTGTIYNVIGDAFGYACLTAFVALLLVLFLRWSMSGVQKK
ncbi:MAG TPA: nitrilase-related carbon-nitrogen hydrolase [Hanamia sp.]